MYTHICQLGIILELNLENNLTGMAASRVRATFMGDMALGGLIRNTVAGVTLMYFQRNKISYQINNTTCTGYYIKLSQLKLTTPIPK